METDKHQALQPELGRRIAVARAKAGLTQAQFSERMGIKDRQTIQAIEAGKRGVSADELLTAMEVTGQTLEFFTDPFRLIGEGNFSFRANGAGEEGLDAFEEQAGRWVAFWREQGRRQKVIASPLRTKLDLNADSTFADAEAAAEALCSEWKLGDVPALRLIEVAEEKLGLLVLQVDAPIGVSGAACQVSGGDTVLINRNDPVARRYFDLAHEIFHVLTWDAMRPQRVDRANPKRYKEKHIEQLADHFAGALLMPRTLIDGLWKTKEAQGVDLRTWFAAALDKFLVSPAALRVRLTVLGKISDADGFEIDGVQQKSAGQVIAPQPFSRRFMERAGRAIERGDVSVRRLVSILDMTGTGGLKQLFAAHGVFAPIE